MSEKIAMHAIYGWILAAAILSQVAKEPSGETSPKPPGAAESALEEFHRDARTYVMNLQTAKPARLELGANPLLHWGNPGRNGEDGAVYAWFKDGRPEVISSIFAYRVAS